MKKIQFETKALNDSAITYAAQELRVNKDFIELNVIEEKKSMLGLNKTYIVEAKVDFDVINDGIEYLKVLLENVQIEGIIEAKKLKERQIIFTIQAKENPILIGKAGKTLDAIQTLLKNYISLYTEETYIVLVDIGGYKEQRKKTFGNISNKNSYGCY